MPVTQSDAQMSGAQMVAPKCYITLNIIQPSAMNYAVVQQELRNIKNRHIGYSHTQKHLHKFWLNVVWLKQISQNWTHLETYLRGDAPDQPGKPSYD